MTILNETWLICGGRYFNDWKLFENSMSEIAEFFGGVPKRIIQGGTFGTDSFASKWGHKFDLEIIQVAEEWSEYGKSAGAIRNQYMLDTYKPDRIIVFPGGISTSHMIHIAKGKIPIVEVGEPKGGN